MRDLGDLGEQMVRQALEATKGRLDVQDLLDLVENLAREDRQVLEDLRALLRRWRASEQKSTPYENDSTMQYSPSR